MAQYCKNCGGETKKIGENTYECLYCGSEFTVTPKVTPPPAPKAAPAPAPVAPAAPKTAAKREWSGEQIYDHAIKTVVEIYAQKNGQAGTFCSSGFVISEKGFVMTNAHAVLDDVGQLCEKIYIKTSTDGRTYSAKPVAVGKPHGNGDGVDLCLLYVPDFHVDPNEFGDMSKVRNGQKVYLIGNSLGAGTCITSGIISDKERAMKGLSYPYIMTDAAANHGNSGGPLYNEYGEVIGVLVAGVDGAKGMNYAIPANVAEEFIRYVVNKTDMKNARLGKLDKYVMPYGMGNYSVGIGVVFSGVKLLMDVIEYIINLCRKN